MEKEKCCEKCKGEFIPKYNGWRCYDPNCPCHQPKSEQESPKCACGKQICLGRAEVEIGGVCHRPNNPCYIIEQEVPKTDTWQERFKLLPYTGQTTESFIAEELAKAEKVFETKLYIILASMETAKDARECRHILKDLILKK